MSLFEIGINGREIRIIGIFSTDIDETYEPSSKSLSVSG